MTSTLTLFDPTAPRRAAATEAARPAFAGLAGAVIGFIDNAKPNFNHLVDDLAEIFTSRYGVARVVKRTKRSASVPAPEAILGELTQECDLVITGSGD